MSTNNITIHRALALIKKTEAILSDRIHNGIFVSTTVGTVNRPTDRSYKNLAELKAAIQSDTDTVDSGLALIVTLKRAIAAKNLETFVDFKGTQVSITELLAIRSTELLRSSYISNLASQINRANIAAEKASSAILAEMANLPAESKAEHMEQLQQINGVNIITATNESPATKLAKLREESQFLVDEVDIILSEINLSTVITY